MKRVLQVLTIAFDVAVTTVNMRAADLPVVEYQGEGVVVNFARRRSLMVFSNATGQAVSVLCCHPAPEYVSPAKVIDVALSQRECVPMTSCQVKVGQEWRDAISSSVSRDAVPCRVQPSETISFEVGLCTNLVSRHGVQYVSGTLTNIAWSGSISACDQP